MRRNILSTQNQIINICMPHNQWKELSRKNFVWKILLPTIDIFYANVIVTIILCLTSSHSGAFCCVALRTAYLIGYWACELFREFIFRKSFKILDKEESWTTEVQNFSIFLNRKPFNSFNPLKFENFERKTFKFMWKTSSIDKSFSLYKLL